MILPATYIYIVQYIHTYCELPWSTYLYWIADGLYLCREIILIEMSVSLLLCSKVNLHFFIDF